MIVLIIISSYLSNDGLLYFVPEVFWNSNLLAKQMNSKEGCTDILAHLLAEKPHGFASSNIMWYNCLIFVINSYLYCLIIAMMCYYISSPSCS